MRHDDRAGPGGDAGTDEHGLDEVDRSFRVRGRVQGVGFRWWTTRAARELGLRGTVKNLSDGSVAVRACGAARDVERLRERLEVGPPSASVERVSEEDGGLPAPPERGFEIAREGG